MINIAVTNIDAIVKAHCTRVLKARYGKKNCLDVDKKTLIETLQDRESLARAAGEIDKQAFFNKLLVDIQLDFDNGLLTAKPHVLAGFINDYSRMFATLLLDKDFRKEVLELLFYHNYDRWDAYQLAKDLDVKICPYCNRQYTFTLGSSKKKGTRPQFDHFFDKASYPFLALSFYNLVPSCSICNSSIKGTDKFTLDTHLHPYVNGFEERVKFTIGPKTINFINGISDAFSIGFRINKNKLSTYSDLKKIIGSYNTFRLKELYNAHKDYVSDIVLKSQAYPKLYCEELYKQFNGTLFSSPDDVKRMVLSNYVVEKDLDKRVLSKLTKDIAEELEIT